jgi:hypothetical protein
MPKRSQRKLNIYDLSGQFGIGYDSKNREFYFDLNDYEIIKNFTWCVSRDCVETKIYGKSYRMHKLIMNYDGELLIDHKNHNVHDNRRENLRFSNKIQNGQNRKSSKGWRYESKNNKYSARITVNKKTIHLGYFSNYQDARNCYLEARRKYFGIFAPEETQ